MKAKTMTPLRKLGLSVLALSLSLLVLLLILTVNRTPEVSLAPPITAVERARLQQLILDSAPTRISVASLQQLSLDEEELNLLGSYGLSIMNLSPRVNSHLELAENKLITRVSYQLFEYWPSLFVNLEAELLPTAEGLEILRLRVGRFFLPDSLLANVVMRLRNKYIHNSEYADELSRLFSSIQKIAIDEHALRAEIVWDPVLLTSLTDRVQQIMLSASDKELIRLHYNRIGEIIDTIPAQRRAISINELLVPLFEAAKNRSLNGSNPIQENVTLFQTLAIYVNNEPITALLGQDSGAMEIKTPRFIEVRLKRRQDLALHLVSMSVLSSSTNPELAELIATTKEAYDARYRSGFSFSDLVANIAGVALGRLASENVSTAHLLQQKMSQARGEEDYMPEGYTQLDGLSESDFEELYTDRSSANYLGRIAELETLVYARPLFTDFSQVLQKR